MVLTSYQLEQDRGKEATDMKRYKIQSTESFEKEMRAVAPENGTHPKMQPSELRFS
jgi:hypothetical protein